MQQFTDARNRQWNIEVNVASIKRVKSLLDVDLMGVIADQSMLPRLYEDPILLCNILYAICKPQCDERGITDEQFGEGLSGDPIDQATKGLVREVANFSPRPRLRAMLNEILNKVDVRIDREMSLAEARIQSGEIDKILDQALATSGATSGNAQASSV